MKDRISSTGKRKGGRDVDQESLAAGGFNSRFVDL